MAFMSFSFGYGFLSRHTAARSASLCSYRLRPNRSRARHCTKPAQSPPSVCDRAQSDWFRQTEASKGLLRRVG